MKDLFTNDAFIEILKSVVPVIITGIITFLITKYSYHKNIPLDKLEIAYDRIYYPIYCLITSEKDIPQIIEKCEWYLKKYRKYADRSTMKAFKSIKKETGLKNNDDIYTNFKDNIYKINTKLRRRLGYLEPNVFDMYTSSAPCEKRTIRLLLEILGIYVPAIIAPYVPTFLDNVVYIVFLIAVCIFAVELVMLIGELTLIEMKKNITKLKTLKVKK